MEMAAIPPTTPPAMAPGFELLPPEPDEDPVKDGVGVVMVVDTVTPLGPKKSTRTVLRFVYVKHW